MNHFIELKDEKGKLVLINVSLIEQIVEKVYSDIGKKTLIAFSGSSVLTDMSFKEIKKLLGLTKKR